MRRPFCGDHPNLPPPPSLASPKSAAVTTRTSYSLPGPAPLFPPLRKGITTVELQKKRYFSLPLAALPARLRRYLYLDYVRFLNECFGKKHPSSSHRCTTTPTSMRIRQEHTHSTERMCQGRKMSDPISTPALKSPPHIAPSSLFCVCFCAETCSGPQARSTQR
jgi:hypothetical protein